MSFILRNGFLHWKEACKPCQGAGHAKAGGIIGICAKCNGLGHTIEKVEPDKTLQPGLRLFQKTLIKYLIDALIVKRPTQEELAKEKELLTLYNRTQEILSEYIYEDGEIKKKEWKPQEPK